METKKELHEKAKKLLEKIEALKDEQGRLGSMSYSQSDPSAVMERRDVRRGIERAEREYDEIIKKLK